MKLSITLALTVASFSPMVFSQVVRDLGSHEHGSATLNVAVDKTALIIELDTPWNNIVGNLTTKQSMEEWPPRMV